MESNRELAQMAIRLMQKHGVDHLSDEMKSEVYRTTLRAARVFEVWLLGMPHSRLARLVRELSKGG